MNFRYKLMRFLSGRYGVDTLFYFIFAVAAILSVINIFVRSLYLQIVVYALVIYAFTRVMSRNFAARQKENRVFKQTADKIRNWSDTRRTRATDYMHIYKKCPNCKAVLRLPRKKGKHKTVCPKCEHEFEVRVFREYKPL